MDLDKLIKETVWEYIEKDFLEEDEDLGGSSTDSGGAPVSKWESGVTRGKANPIDPLSKWLSDLVRGKANPVDQESKWESGVTRGKGNPLT